MVLNQCGSSDISQSNEANVTVKPNATSEMPARRCIARVCDLSPVSSWASECRQ